MKIEFTEEKNKSIMEDMITSPLDVEDMMAVGYALAKQAIKPPTYKIDPDFPHIGPGYYCECGVRFEWWHRPEGQTSYCGNCGQRLK